jgi:hypothetical protein
MVHIGRPGLGTSAVGLWLGLILCAVMLRAMRSILYGIGTYDAATMAPVVLTLSLVTLFATAVPTLRVASTDPTKTLLEE